MKNIVLFVATSFTFALLGSCSKDTTTTGGGGVTPPDTLTNVGFDYATVSEKNINIKLIDLQGSAVANTKITVYGQNPINAADGTFVSGAMEIASKQTDNNGSVSFNLNLPTESDSVYVITYMAGYVNPTAINVSGISQINQTIAPAGYSTKTRAYFSESEDNGNTQNAKMQLVRGNIYKMSDWDYNGVPSYRTKNRDVVSQSMLNTVNSALPNYVICPQAHPEFFTNPLKANVEIIKDAELWVTFISEGAGYRSTMGYFTYPTNNPPQSVADIKERYVIFPNVSFVGSGGGLVSGDKVQLMYKNKDNTYTTIFPAGTSVGWFVISDGFRNNAISDGNWTLYSFDKFNPGAYQQTVVLNDPANKLMYISFEDITRTNGGCDQDFNDVVFYCTASPYTAINQEGVPVVVAPKDTDGDGVTDDNDAYPTDPKLAYDSYYPAKGVYSTVAFEDLWPAKGDYDFNDLVVDLNFHHQLNAQNNVVNIIVDAKLRAVGGSYHNGFALGFNVSKNSIKSVSGQRLTDNVFSIGANGTENGNSNAVIPVFANGYALFGNRPYTNTFLDQPKMDDVTISMVITLTTPLPQSLLGTAPYDPFMIIDRQRPREVHLMNHRPTDLAELSYLGTEQDLSSAAKGVYYVAKNGRPWAIQIPARFTYPIEKSNISDTYKHFNDWASSNGTAYRDWYSNSSSSYRDASKLYNK